MDKLTRRAFLSHLSLLFGSGLAAELIGSADCLGFEPRKGQGSVVEWTDAGEFKGRKFKLGPWTGDNFTRGHELRDAMVPQGIIETNRAVDFVIVGGGLAGLTASHYLRDHDFLLLEQYDEFGGQSRGASRHGIDFTYGAAYLRPPENEMGELLADLQLKPIKFDTRFNNEKCRDEFRKFERDSKPIWEKIRTRGLADLSSELKKLDQSLFSSAISSYSPEFMSIVDAMLRTSTCGGVEKTSALAGYSAMQDIFSPCFSFSGGNGAITRAIARSFSAPAVSRADSTSSSSNASSGRSPINASNASNASNSSNSSRILSNTFVWSMEVTESGVNIIYSDGAGHMHGVQAKHAIVTVPPMVAARILKNLDNATKASMLGFRYGSYLVANCFFSKPVYDGSFSNWCSAPFTFSNILIATETYKKEGLYAKDMGQALTVYQPYLPGSEGRTLLLEGDRTKLSHGILEQLAPIFSQLEASLDSIVLSRWGHAMPVMNVGYFARMARLTSMEHARFSLSHSSSQGMQCAESAVLAARLAVNQALKVKAQAKPLIFFDSVS